MQVRFDFQETSTKNFSDAGRSLQEQLQVMVLSLKKRS
jgi:hypothetical protein